MVKATRNKEFIKADIGPIPNDWTVRQVKDFTDVVSGGTPSTKISEYWSGNIRWMNSGELNLKRIYEVEGRITETGLKNSATKLIPSNCVLIGLAGQGKTRGTVALNYVPLCTNQSIASILPNDDVTSDYLYHNLDLRYKELRSLSTGEGGRGGLNLRLIKNLQVPLPPKAEQIAIATALNDVDTLINQLIKLISKNRALKESIMQNLLTGTIRLFGAKEIQKGYKKTEIGNIPNDWNIVRLGNVLEFKNGLNKEKKYFGHGTPIVNYMDVYKNSGIRAKLLRGKVSLSIQELKNYEVRKGDVFFTRTSETVDEIGISSVVLEELERTTFSGFVLRGRPVKDIFVNEFCQFCFSSRLVRKQILTTASYTTRALTNGRLLSDIIIPIPPTKAEQIAIANVLSDADKLITQLENQVDKYKMIKQGMRQNLLTGKIRLI